MIDRIKTNCPRDCYDGCGIVVERRSGESHRVLGDPDHPVSRGKLCSKCAVAYNGVWQDKTQRLLHPLRRVGPKGSTDFERISWDEALAAVADKMNAAIDSNGASSILHTHYSGTLSLIGYAFPNRLFNYLGASEVDPDSICNAAGHVAWTLQFGNSVQGFDPRTSKDSKCILVWGANPSHSAPHAHEHWLGDTSAQVIVVDPIRTETAAAADLHLQPRPGSDAALAFCLLHCLEQAGQFDEQYIESNTLGFEEIIGDIHRATPSWGEEQTGVPAVDIERAASIYGTGPSLLWCGQGLQRQTTGGNIMRAVGLLPALTGNIGKPGAGFSYLNVTPVVAGIDFDWLTGKALSTTHGKTVSHMELAQRLENDDEFKVFFSWNTNPLASAPEQKRLRDALKRDDLFTVVCDIFMTDTATYADIVLPAASFLEYDDLTWSYFHYNMGAQAKISDPMGESLPNAEVFRKLARAMDLNEPMLFESDECLITTMMGQMALGLDFEELKRRGYHAITPDPLVVFSEQKFDTPSGKIEIASIQAEKMGLPRAAQRWCDEPNEPGLWRLLTPASKWRMNDSYSNDAHIDKQAGPPRLHLNPDDAAQLTLKDGAPVEISNELGSIKLLACIDDGVPSRTVVTYKGRWPRLEETQKNINFLHKAQMADMGGSSSVHSTQVKVQAVRAHDGSDPN